MKVCHYQRHSQEKCYKHSRQLRIKKKEGETEETGDGGKDGGMEGMKKHSPFIQWRPL